MGTRSLIAVYMNGEYKIAQCSQWDGYPEGQGLGCLRFLTNEMIEHRFRKQLMNLRLIQTELQMTNIVSTYKEGTAFPEFDRDTGSEILKIVQDGKTTTGCVANNIGFAAGAGIFGCEWAWVIDLDRRMFEAYEGYNKEPLTEDERFYFLEPKSSNGYHPVKLVAAWCLSDLPEEKEFLKTFELDDE